MVVVLLVICLVWLALLTGYLVATARQPSRAVDADRVRALIHRRVVERMEASGATSGRALLRQRLLDRSWRG